MTASWGTQQARRNTGNQTAYNKLNNRYNNQNMLNDFMDAVNSGSISSGLGNFYKSKDKYVNYDAYADDLIKKFGDQQKNSLQDYLDRTFTGIGGSNLWADNYWSSNSDDDLVNNFINNEYNTALEQLERALNRGTLTQSGYNDALNNLNLQKSGAQTTIGSIGQGIIDNYRNDLINKASSFNTDVDNYNLSMYDTINPEAFQKSFDDLYNNQLGNFESEFNLQTQDLNPFDITQIIGDARVSQGVNNTQPDQLLGAIEDNEKKKDDKVGLGNQGLF